jgi:hypothetical protein
MCNIVCCAFVRLHYIFWPEWPFSGVEIVVFHNCDAVFFLMLLPVVILVMWVAHVCFSAMCEQQIPEVQQPVRLKMAI